MDYRIIEKTNDKHLQEVKDRNYLDGKTVEHRERAEG